MNAAGSVNHIRMNSMCYSDEENSIINDPNDGVHKRYTQYTLEEILGAGRIYHESKPLR